MKALFLTPEILKSLQAGIEAKGAQFAAVEGYTNKQGEVSNQVFIINFSYGNAKDKDIETLKNATISDFKAIAANNEGLTVELISKYTSELLESLINPSKTRSQAQKDAYTPVKDTTMKVHNETGVFYAYALQVYKKVITKGEYKTVNHREKTVYQNAIKKHFDLRTAKFRQFALTSDKVDFFNANGQRIEF